MIQVPLSYMKTTSKAIGVFLEMQGIELLQGDVWGHRKDLDEYFTVEDAPEGEYDYQLFKAIIRVASNSNVSPYNADKVFWLIGSGNFYEDQEIGTNGRIGSHKQEFIDFARSKILLDGRIRH